MVSEDAGTLVAVYGTLKRGHSNHRLLADARFVGEDRLHGLCLYNLGPYPAVAPGRSAGVVVEVYDISPQQLQQLDILEDCYPASPEKSLYIRKQMQTRHGLAWIYLYNRNLTGYRPMRSGSW